MVVERVEGKVGQDLAGTCTDGDAPAGPVDPNEQLEYVDGPTAFKHLTDFGHQRVVIDTVKEFTYICFKVVFVSAG